MKLTYAFAPIVKIDKNDDGTRTVTGKASGPDLDADKQICDPAWLAKSLPAWFGSGANVREMHQPIAAGVGQALEQAGEDWNLKALVVDAGSVKKVDAKVLGGYSIGIKDARVVKDAAAPGGRIVGGDIVEVSLVDRPANPTCKLSLAKADGTDVDGDVIVDVAEETQEAVTVDMVRQLIAALIYGEAEELLEDGGAGDAIRALMWVLSDLDWFEQVDAYEDAVSKAASATTKGSIMHLTDLVTSVKAATADTATETQKSVLTEVREALFPTTELETVVGELDIIKGLSFAELTKIDSVDKLDDEQKTAVAGLRKLLGVDDLATTATKAAGSEGRVTALEERLEKVEELAAPGGPDRTRPAEAAKAARQTELLTKAASAREMADKVTDQAAADSYRKLAERLEAQANAAPAAGTS